MKLIQKSAVVLVICILIIILFFPYQKLFVLIEKNINRQLAATPLQISDLVISGPRSGRFNLLFERDQETKITVPVSAIFRFSWPPKIEISAFDGSLLVKLFLEDKNTTVSLDNMELNFLEEFEAGRISGSSEIEMSPLKYLKRSRAEIPAVHFDFFVENLRVSPFFEAEIVSYLPAPYGPRLFDFFGNEVDEINFNGRLFGKQLEINSLQVTTPPSIMNGDFTLTGWTRPPQAVVEGHFILEGPFQAEFNFSHRIAELLAMDPEEFFTEIVVLTGETKFLFQ